MITKGFNALIATGSWYITVGNLSSTVRSVRIAVPLPSGDFARDSSVDGSLVCTHPPHSSSQVCSWTQTLRSWEIDAIHLGFEMGQGEVPVKFSGE